MLMQIKTHTLHASKHISTGASPLFASGYLSSSAIIDITTTKVISPPLRLLRDLLRGESDLLFSNDTTLSDTALGLISETLSESTKGAIAAVGVGILVLGLRG